jgi:hypothetical protein
LRNGAPLAASGRAAYYTALGSPLGASGDGPDAGAGAREVRPGLWAVPPPTTEVDSGDAVAAGEALFRALCGEEPPFLPAMPEPSDNEDPDSHAGARHLALVLARGQLMAGADALLWGAGQGSGAAPDRLGLGAGVVLEEPSERGEQWHPAEEETVGAGSEAIDPPPSHSS